jgi:hypothetical protein
MRRNLLNCIKLKYSNYKNYNERRNLFRCLVANDCQLGGLMSESWTEDWVASVTFKKVRLRRKNPNEIYWAIEIK